MRSLAPKILEESWIPSGLCGIGFNKLWDNPRPSWPKIRSRGWHVSTKGVIDLIDGDKGIKWEIFVEFDATILVRSLSKGNLGQETVLELGLAISRYATIGFHSNLESLLRKYNVVVE